jgi:hypothetical protein
MQRAGVGNVVLVLVRDRVRDDGGQARSTENHGCVSTKPNPARFDRARTAAYGVRAFRRQELVQPRMVP